MRIPTLAAVIGFILIILVEIYIFFDLRKLIRGRYKKVALIADAVLSLAGWVVLLIVILYPKKDPQISILPAMWMLYSVISIYLAKFAYCVCSLIGRAVNRGPSPKGAVAGLILACFVFGFMWWGVCFTRNDITVNEVTISSAKIPKSFNGFRILQFSDIHSGTWGNDTTFISELVNIINSQHADVVLFTGDIINRQSSEVKPFLNILSRVKAPYGVFGVYGNHDYAGYSGLSPAEQNKDFAKLDSMLNSIGWDMLKNKTRFIRNGNDSIVLIGVENWGEPPFNQLGDLGKSYPEKADKFHGLNDDMFKILMTHNPNYWDQIVVDISNIDLSLAGHTHAMQFMFKVGGWQWSPSKYRYPQWSGVYENKAKDGTDMNLYVNIGVGEVGFPARLGAAKPELTVFTLKSE